jgi:hypothetical protein
MKTDIIFFASDTINRYGFRIDIEAFERLIKNIHEGGMPMLVGHDFHRPVGWNLPFGVFIKPGIAFATACRWIAQNEADQSIILSKTNHFLNDRYENTFIPVNESFLNSLSTKVEKDSLKIDCGCAAIMQTDIAINEFKEFFEGTTPDKSGLLPLSYVLSEFDYYKQGIFKHKKKPLCVFAHQFFRRSQSRFNNFFFSFLDELITLSENPDLTIRIKLDSDLIGYSPSCREMGELAYHFGPKYNDQIDQIKHGITKHQCSDLQRKFSGISVTEFFGKHDGNEFTFESEEIRDSPSGTTDDHYACRYVHAIYEKNSGNFRHFDGAIRSYNFESIIDRVAQSFLEAGRKAEYTKLFRIDGKLTISKWKTLVTHYYQENPLIYEYFDVDLTHLTSQLPLSLSPVRKVLPFEIKAEAGLKILLSYHEIREPLKEGRYVDVFDRLSTEDRNTYFLEHNVFEVKFALAKLGEELSIPDDIDFLKLGDDLWNIPSIMHFGENHSNLLSKTIEAMRNLFKAMIQRSIHKTISLTLSYVVNDRIVRISSFGAIQNQLNWLESLTAVPMTEEDLNIWVTAQRKYLDKFTPSDDDALDEALLQQDGVLYIKRVQLLTGFKIENSGSEGYSILLLEDGIAEEVRDMCLKKQIRPVLALKINRAVWSDTGENYFTSQRSKWMDKLSGNLVITENGPSAVFWAKQN